MFSGLAADFLKFHFLDPPSSSLNLEILYIQNPFENAVLVHPKLKKNPGGTPPGPPHAAGPQGIFG